MDFSIDIETGQLLPPGILLWDDCW